MLLATRTEKIAYVAGLTLFLTSIGSWAVLSRQNDLPMSAAVADEQFVKEAASGGAAEIKLGELAEEKGSNQTVKSFGTRMIAEHTKAGDHLKEAAAKEHITLPVNLSAKDQATYDRLSQLAGAEFNRAYAEDMVKDHRQDLLAFQREANHGKDEVIRGFASETIPMIQQHLNQAKEMLKAVSQASSRRTKGRANRFS